MQCNVTFVEKESHQILLKIKITDMLEDIAILQVNTEVQRMVFLILDLMIITKFMQFSTTGQTMIIISS